jgi:hypothetical protein
VVFAFGGHPQAAAADAHPVTSAIAAGNRLRLVMDERLRASDLEEIGCRYAVDDDAFAPIPPGATPEDVSRCAAAQEALAARCPGTDRRSLCVCRNDAGCPSGNDDDGNPRITPTGESVGVLDRDQDGAADRTRFVAGAAGIRCGPIDVPIDLDASHWSPSGNQQASSGFDALGPAVVLVPAGALPSGAVCGVVFSPEVADEDGNRVCAPPGGDVAIDCTPGDTRAVTFTVEPLRFALAAPILDPGQGRTADVAITASAPIDPASLARITVTEDPATSYALFTATTAAADPRAITIRWTAMAGLAPNTRYTITIPAGVTDAYQRAAPTPFVVAFTTGAR